MKHWYTRNKLLSGRATGLFAPATLLGSLLLLTSCAGTPSADSASADEECVYVRVTGSNLPIKECRSRAEREAIAAANEQAAQNSLRDIQLLDEAGDQSLGADSLFIE